MFCLYYENERQQAKAVVAIARRCQKAKTAFAFVGSPAECGAARTAMQRLAAAGGGPIFREAELAVKKHSPAAVNESIRALRATLLELAADGRPMVVWVESPLMPDGAAHPGAMWMYRNAVKDFAALAPLRVVNAFRFSQMGPAVRANLFEAAHAVLSVRAIYPLCPPWVIEAPREAASAGRAAEGAAAPAPGFAFGSLLQAENLATIGQMAAGFAHELGNPLTVISTSMQLLQQRFGAAGDPAGEFAALALKNVERMKGLLQDMRDVTGVRERQFQAAELKTVVSEVLRFAAAEFRRRRVTLQVRFDSSLPPVRVDPNGIKQVLLNLVRNALEAMREGGTLRVRAVWSRDGNTAVVKIANTGPAIAPADLPCLFQPFFTTKKEGTGLGLFLSRKIAREHGGDLAVENLPGGVRFVLTLPLAPREKESHGENINCG
jgi:signal transduction histidine kinase